MWASVSSPWAAGGGKGELAGVLLLEGAEAGPWGRTCCLGQSSAAWLASPASPPGGPQEARRHPAATPWPASPLGGQTDRRVRAILTPMLPHGRWNLLGWGAQAGRPGAKPLACLHLQPPASPGSAPRPPCFLINGDLTMAAPSFLEVDTG